MLSSIVSLIPDLIMHVFSYLFYIQITKLRATRKTTGRRASTNANSSGMIGGVSEPHKRNNELTTTTTAEKLTRKQSSSKSIKLNSMTYTSSSFRRFTGSEVQSPSSDGVSDYLNSSVLTCFSQSGHYTFYRKYNFS